MNLDEIPQSLIDILDRRAGKRHSRTGPVLACLAEILTHYEGMRAMRTWRFDESRPPGDGPWIDEPDKAQWVDPTTDLDCLAVRNHGGAWCGYVGLPPDHPLHGVGHGDLPHLDVHGGVNYSDHCVEVDGSEDGPYICHVPEPGRPAKVWWVGFDCGHAFDLRPTMDARLKALPDSATVSGTGRVPANYLPHV